MANNLIPQELDALIQEYLTDGVLTDKERQVILRKAEGMGLDRDEIDLYLDAQVQKIDLATDAAARKQKGKQCPYCGGSIPQLTDKCPHCGENITAEASSELQEIFDNLEEALVDFKSGKDIAKSKATVERYMRKAKMYYGNNPKIQRLLEEVELESEKAEKIAKANARKNAFVKILTYNWKITVAVCIIILLLLWWAIGSIVSAFKGPDALENPQTCIEAVKQAINDGNFDKAAGYCTAYTDKHGIFSNDKITTAYAMASKAYIENGEYDKAISLVDGVWEMEDVELNSRKQIVKKCIEDGKYDEAESYGDFEYDGFARYFDYLCKCIDHMKSKGDSNQAIKSFIDRKINTPQDRYGKWDSKTMPAKIYEYAGIK